MGVIVRRKTPLIVLVMAWSLSGCGLFESAGEVAIGEGQIPELVLDFELPNHAQFLERSREHLGDGDGVPDSVSIENATLAHILGVVALTGQCERTFTKPGKKDLGAASDLQARFVACPDNGVCDHICGGHRGVMLLLETDVLAMTQKTARDVNAKVSQRIEDSLVGVRLRFNEVNPYRKDGTTRAGMLEWIAGLSATVVDGNSNELALLRDVHIQLIRSGQRPRSTFDPGSPLTRDMVKKIQANQEVTFKLKARVLITRSDAYHWPIFNSGVRLRIQPEFVISVLGSVTG